MGRLLAHPLRDRLLFEYQGDPTSPSKVARRLGESVSLVSYHTDVLARNGCLELVRTERRRGAIEHFYRAIVAQDIEDEDWPRVSAPIRRTLVRGVLGAATDEARRAALDGSFDEPRSHISRSLLELDDQAISEVSRILRQVVDDVARISAESRARAAPDRRPYELVILHFAPTRSAPKPPDRIRAYRF
jgi:DNA-binding transcriptional ArsR family regulator